MPLSSHVPASGLSAANHPLAAPPASFRPLSSQATAEEQRAWNANLPAAQQLFARLQSTFHPDLLARQVSIAHPDAPGMPVNPRTLLKQGERSDLAGMQLHANWIGGNDLLMAVPRHREALAWATACFEQDIGAVVSLGTMAEHDELYPCMENDGPLVADGRQIEFKDADEGECDSRAAKDLTAAHPGTFAGIVQINMRKLDKAVPAAMLEVLSCTVPISPNQAIRPGVLLSTCRLLHEETAGRPTAFQSPQGDHRSAVFAAAHGLYQQFAKGELDAHNLEQSVVQQCIDLRAARSAALFDQPDHLASLLTMGTLMLAGERPKTAGSSVGRRAPEVVSAPVDAPPRSAMRGARARALPNATPRPKLHFSSDIVGKQRASTHETKHDGWSENDLVKMRQNPGRKGRP